jgi:hypothetical protein
MERLGKERHGRKSGEVAVSEWGDERINTRRAARSSTWVKCCVRFKKLEDLALDVVGRTVARVSAEEHMANYRAARALLGKGRKAKPKK